MPPTSHHPLVLLAPRSQMWPLGSTATTATHEDPSRAAPGWPAILPPRDHHFDHCPPRSSLSHTALSVPRTKTSKSPFPVDTTAGPPTAWPWRSVGMDHCWPGYHVATATDPSGLVTASISWWLGASAAPGVSPGAGWSPPGISQAPRPWVRATTAPLGSLATSITWTLGRPVPSRSQVVEVPLRVTAWKTPTSVAARRPPLPSGTTEFTGTWAGRSPVRSVQEGWLARLVPS